VALVIQTLPTPQQQSTILAVHHVHTSLLIASSAYFRRHALPPTPWNVDEHRVVDVKIYVDWLYTGTVCSQKADPQLCEYTRLAKLHTLGVELEDNTFQTAIADACLEKVIEELGKPDSALPNSQCLQ